jgi:hypothetical protein
MFCCELKQRRKKATFCSEILSARSIVYTLEPARLHAIKATITMDEIVPAQIDRAIGVTKSDSATPAEEDDADEEKK